MHFIFPGRHGYGLGGWSVVVSPSSGVFAGSMVLAREVVEGVMVVIVALPGEFAMWIRASSWKEVSLVAAGVVVAVLVSTCGVERTVAPALMMMSGVPSCWVLVSGVSFAVMYSVIPPFCGETSVGLPGGIDSFTSLHVPNDGAAAVFGLVLPVVLWALPVTLVEGTGGVSSIKQVVWLDLVLVVVVVITTVLVVGVVLVASSVTLVAVVLTPVVVAGVV